MIEDLPARVNGNAGLVRRGRFVDTVFLVEIGADSYLVRIVEGRIAGGTTGPFVMPSWCFALRAPREAWEAFWQPVPAPGFNYLLALVKRRLLRIEGDLHPFMANLRYFKEVM